jgi:hypothetical protein
MLAEEPRKSLASSAVSSVIEIEKSANAGKRTKTPTLSANALIRQITEQICDRARALRFISLPGGEAM